MTNIATQPATGGQGGYLLFWKPDEAEDGHRLKLPDTARDLALAPDHRHVVTAHYDGHLRVHLMEKKAEAPETKA